MRMSLYAGGYPSPVVHRMLAASMFGKVLGVKFPGEGTINLERSFIFVRPVFVGQTYTMTFKVKEIDQIEKRVKLEYNVGYAIG